MFKILLVDDSEDIGFLIKSALNPYEIHQKFTLSEAESSLKDVFYDLILIDVRMPDGNGFDLCLKLSQSPRHETIPRIMITSCDQPMEKVFGFNCGADDYITKPFEVMELKARIDRYLKRRMNPKEANWTSSCFLFNTEFQKCYLIDGDKQIDLHMTPTEFRLFLVLARNEGRVLSREFLEKSIWEAIGVTIKARGIDTHIAHLRKKIGTLGRIIVSVYGQGYSYKISEIAPKSQAN